MFDRNLDLRGFVVELDTGCDVAVTFNVRIYIDGIASTCCELILPWLVDVESAFCDELLVCIVEFCWLEFYLSGCVYLELLLLSIIFWCSTFDIWVLSWFDPADIWPEFWLEGSCCGFVVAGCDWSIDDISFVTWFVWGDTSTVLSEWTWFVAGFDIWVLFWFDPAGIWFEEVCCTIEGFGCVAFVPIRLFYYCALVLCLFICCCCAVFLYSY